MKVALRPFTVNDCVLAFERTQEGAFRVGVKE